MASNAKCQTAVMYVLSHASSVGFAVTMFPKMFENVGSVNLVVDMAERTRSFGPLRLSPRL